MMMMGIDMGFPGGICIACNPRQPQLVHIEPISKHDSALVVFQRVGELMDRYQVRTLATERPFTGRFDMRPKVGLAQREHQGQLKLLCDMRRARFVDYAPSTIKKATAGNGRASKPVVAAAVRRLLQLSEGLTEHEYDAAAICLLALNREG